MIYILRFELCLLSIAVSGLILLWLGRDRIRSAAEGMYRNAVLCFGVSFAFAASTALSALAQPIAAVVPTLLRSFETLCFCEGIYFWCGYCETLMGKTVFDSKRGRLLTQLPLAAAFIALLANLFTGFLFQYDAKGLFLHKAGEFVFHDCLVLCALPSGIRLARYAESETEPYRRLSHRLTACLPLVLLLRLLLLNAEDSLPVTCPLTAILLLCVYMGVLRRQVSMDPLTQVNNRHNLMNFMNYKLKNRTGDMCLMMIDIDDFKRINDSYGHLEGDRALIVTASALKKACGGFPRRPYIARYGGDEFIILLDGGLSQAETLKSSITDQMISATVGHDQSRLSLSIGMSLYQPGFDARQWIESADRKLYEIKPKKAGR